MRVGERRKRRRPNARHEKIDPTNHTDQTKPNQPVPHSSRTEGAVAVLVRRGDLHERHVDGEDAAAEEVGDLAQEDGHVLGAPLRHGLAHVGPHEEAGRLEDAPALRGHVGGRALCRWWGCGGRKVLQQGSGGDDDDG